MTTLSKEDVVQLIEELGAGSNWLSGKHDVYSYNRQPKIAAMFLKAFAEQGLLELIAELRKPHNWKIEGFGHFKDVKMHQSDAPFRAATALEHFAALICADLVAENERLKEMAMFFSTYTDPDELEMDEIENAARESFRRANSGVRGTTITRANSYESHVIWATKARIGNELAAARTALAELLLAINNYIPEADHYSDDGVKYYSELVLILDKYRK